MRSVVLGFGALDRLRQRSGRFLAERGIAALLPECVVIAAFISLIWISIGAALSHEHATADRDAMQETSNLARAFEDNAQRIVTGIDRVLLSLRAAYAADPDGFDLDAWEQQQNRPDRLTVHLGLIGPTGVVASSTLRPAAVPIDLSDREHFRVHLDPAHDDLFISKPVLGRGTGRWAVQFTRKLLRRDGSFGGVAVVSLGCAELSSFYGTVQTGRGYTLLAGTDGIVRARGPLIEGAIGADLQARPYFSRMMAEREGTFHLPSILDGIERILSFRRLQDYPLMVVVGFDDGRAYESYYAARRRMTAIGLVVTAVITLLGVFWIIQRRRSTASSRALQATLDAMIQGIVMIDAHGRVPVMNRRAAELLGLKDATAATPGAGRSGKDLAACLRSIGAAGPAALAQTLQRCGRLIETDSRPTPFGGTVLTYTDVTDRRRDEARILHLAHHDGLTGLANRVLLSERIAEATSEAGANGTHFAVLTLDLDGFKAVNDGLGHDAGDLLLVHAAERLRGTVRAHDTVARVGGDEFTVVVRNITEAGTAERIAADLIRALAEPISIESGLCAIGASVGIALFPSDGAEAGTLLKNADVALYRAKEAGRGQHCRYQAWMNEVLEERRWLERELRIGLERDELEVHFQPQFSCDTFAVTGFEALVRWRHPDRGLIPPASFIPVAEECGMVIPIGRTVLERACALAVTWRPRCRVAVNLSPVQFRDASLPEFLAGVLRRSGLPPDLLELEVTEGVLIGDEAQALETLRALRGLGVRIALDDFGTGYSSLSYLHRFTFDKVKIDKSFVQAQQRDIRARSVLDAVLAMSSSLGLLVTAEGVETEDQLRSLCEQGCTEVQGFLLGRPMPASEVTDFLARAANAANPVAQARPLPHPAAKKAAAALQAA